MITCECGSSIRKSGMSEHIQSKKHQDYLLTIDENTIEKVENYNEDIIT